MGNTVYITLKVMPDSPEANLDSIREAAEEAIGGVGNVANTKEEPVAFGLKALVIVFSMDEEKGDTEELEKKIESLDQVQSVQVTDVRRAIG